MMTARTVPSINQHAFAAVAILILVTSGCSGGPDTDAMFAEANSTNAQRAATLYSVYQAQHSWKGPENREQLLEFAQGLPAHQLEQIGVDPAAIETTLDQGSDGQPLKIRWGINSGPRDPARPIVFESSAVDGKYKVAFTAYGFRQVEQAEYDQLWSGAEDNSATAGQPDGQR